MKTSKSKGVLAYKVFYRRITPGENKTTYTCGHNGCALHAKIEVTKPDAVILKGTYTENTQLQKVGDKASLPNGLTVQICKRGWHAVTPAHLRDWISMDEWRSGKKTIFLVRLSGDLVRAQNKLAARHIEMLQEIPYKSNDGDKLRAKIRNAQQAEIARDRARALARRKARKEREAKLRIRRRRVELHNRQIQRAIKELTLKLNRAKRNLQAQFNRRKRETVKRLGGWQR